MNRHFIRAMTPIVQRFLKIFGFLVVISLSAYLTVLPIVLIQSYVTSPILAHMFVVAWFLMVVAGAVTVFVTITENA